MNSLAMLNSNVPLWQKLLNVVEDIFTKADIIALQEVRGLDKNLAITRLLERRQELKIVSNGEFAFVYNKNKVTLVKADCDSLEMYAYFCRFRVQCTRDQLFYQYDVYHRTVCVGIV